MLTLREITVRDVGPVSIDISPGEIVVISGKSGAGKTVLLRSIADLDPHEGEVYLGNTACGDTHPADWRKMVGMLPTESRWWNDRVAHHFNSWDKDFLYDLNFSEAVLEWEVKRLSTGEKQRLALLRLLSNRPEALLLDEPTASLDPDNVHGAEELLLRYIRGNSVPVIWISHSPEQGSRIADRLFELEGGQLRSYR